MCLTLSSLYLDSSNEESAGMPVSVADCGTRPRGVAFQSGLQAYSAAMRSLSGAARVMPLRKDTLQTPAG